MANVKKPFHGVVYWGWWKIPVADSWEKLTPSQQIQAAYWLSMRDISEKECKIRLLMILLRIYQNWPRTLLFFWFTNANELQEMLQLTAFFFRPSDKLYLPFGQVLVKKKPSFIEMIKLEEEESLLILEEQEFANILAIRYRPEVLPYSDEWRQQNLYIFEALRPSILRAYAEACLVEAHEVRARWGKLYPPKRPKKSKPALFGWYSVLRDLAKGDPAKYDQVAALPAETIYFEITERLHEAAAEPEKP